MAHGYASGATQPPVHDELRPLVYRTLVGLTIWLVVSIWLLFDRGHYVRPNLAVITAFFLIVVGVPLLLSLTSRRNCTGAERATELQKFREWAACEFSTWTGSLSGPRGRDADPVADRRGRHRHDNLRPRVLFGRPEPQLTFAITGLVDAHWHTKSDRRDKPGDGNKTTAPPPEPRPAPL